MNRQLLIEYEARIAPLIKKILDTVKKEFVFTPTLLGDHSDTAQERARVAFHQKQIKMKEGDIGQIMIGNWIGWEDLGIGHPTKLDNRKIDNTCIMELKNNYNTCNSGSRTSVLNNLAKYKKENLATDCIFGMLNPKKNQRVLRKRIIHNGVEIIELYGEELLDYVFTHNSYNYKKEVIEIVRRNMYEN